MPRSPGRAGHRWRQTRAAILAVSTHCALCHEPLDFTARPGSSRSPSIDHIRPLGRGGDPLNPANLRPAHFGCNSARGNRDRRTRRTETSRQWL